MQYSLITVKNISGDVINYAPLALPNDYTLTAFDINDTSSYTYATVLLKDYPSELYEDFVDGNVEITVDGITLTTKIELNEVYTHFRDAFTLHKVGYYGSMSPFYFNMLTNEWICRNPVDGKEYSILLTERIEP